MIAGEGKRGAAGVVAELGIHVLLLGAVAFAIYPILWVVSLALSPGDAPEASILPIPTAPSLRHFEAVVSTTSNEGVWLFGRQLANSLIIAIATSLTAIAIATPAAYALARFDFVELSPVSSVEDCRRSE